MVEEKGLRIAVVGGGVAGIVSAHLLSRAHDVTVYEANDYLGGHTNTVVLDAGPDEGVAVDTGFIVLNDQTYPLLHSFFRELSVPVRWSCMSFGYLCERTGFEYAGTDLNGLFSDRGNIVNPSFYSFLKEIWRFSSVSNAALKDGTLGEMSVGDFVKKHSFSKKLVNDFLIPMSGAIWSAPQNAILGFSAEMLLRFFDNHGLLKLFNRPRWQTVVGGSHSYVKAFKESFSGKIHLSSPVSKVVRSKDEVEIQLSSGEKEIFDYVVVALHADLAYKVLDAPTPEEERLLGCWRYENNHTVLHYDESILPPNRRTWASWNYVREDEGNSDDPVRVTYHMNRLQGLETQREYCVTLNKVDRIDPSKIIKEFNYTHPAFDKDSLKAQDGLRALSGENRTFYCGSYFGYGFHEDATRSAVEAGAHFGEQL